MLRRLELKDAINMLECLRDPNVNKFMNIDGSKMSISDCEEYIRKSWDDNKNKHFAIVDKNDDWVGTISLKNIDNEVQQAEYAIITSSSVHGKGFALEGTKAIIDYGFKKLNLKRIYLNVVADNIRANKFYEKAGFEFEGCFRKTIKIKNKIYDLNWYSLLNY